VILAKMKAAMRADSLAALALVLLYVQILHAHQADQADASDRKGNCSLIAQIF